MAALTWDTPGTRRFETGVDHGVLYIPNESGVYDNGFAWNGLTKVAEKPTGATTNPTYADNIKYLNLVSLEEFTADISAITYPEEFAPCDGTQEPEPGVAINQQPRVPFGLCYRTQVGTDLNNKAGNKLHLVYNALAAPSQKEYASINATPNAIEFSWTITTTPVPVTGHEPVATMTIDTTKVDATALTTLENFLYGTAGTNPSLPTPDEVLAIFSGTVTSVTPTVPTYTSATHTITIPVVTGVTYYIDGMPVTGDVVITSTKVVEAIPNAGYKFPDETDNTWQITYS